MSSANLGITLNYERWFICCIAELQCRGTLINLKTEPAKTLGNWARCKALHLRWNKTPCTCMCWKVTVWVAILLKRSWCDGGCCAEHEPTTQGHLSKWNGTSRLCWEKCGWQMKGSDYHQLCSDESLPAVLCQSRGVCVSPVHCSRAF